MRPLRLVRPAVHQTCCTASLQNPASSARLCLHSIAPTRCITLCILQMVIRQLIAYLALSNIRYITDVQNASSRDQSHSSRCTSRYNPLSSIPHISMQRDHPRLCCKVHHVCPSPTCSSPLPRGHHATYINHRALSESR
jgi:hypothetical protein